MKIIDLLNKIANGEEVKFKVLQSGEEYYIKKGKFLHNELGEEVNWYINEEWLNEEVEIIEDEENEDIPLIPDDELYEIEYTNNSKHIDYNFKVLKEKINQILEVINNGTVD